MEKEFGGEMEEMPLEEQRAGLETERRRLKERIEQGDADEDEAKRMLEQLKAKDAELEALMLGEQTAQTEGVRAKLARRKQLKKEKLQKLREKQAAEQLEMADSHKNRIKEKRR